MHNTMSTLVPHSLARRSKALREVLVLLWDTCLFSLSLHSHVRVQNTSIIRASQGVGRKFILYKILVTVLSSCF